MRGWYFAALAALGLLAAQSALAQTPLGQNPTVPAFLPMASAVPKTQPLAIDGTWTITSIGKRIRIEAGRAYAVDPWLHLFVLQIQPGMVVLENLRSTSPGHYVGQDLPLMGSLQAELTPDGNLNVSVAGALGPAKYQLVPVELDDRSWYNREVRGEGSLPDGGDSGYAGQNPGDRSLPHEASPSGGDDSNWTAGKYPGVIPPAAPDDQPKPDNAMLPERAAPLRVGRAKPIGCGTLTDNLYLSPRNGGECWSCPAGYARNLSATVTSAHACAQRNALGVGKFIKGPFKRASFVRTAAGCEEGDFRVSGGDCMRCPDGYERQQVLGLDAKTCKRKASAGDLLKDDAKLASEQMAPLLKELNEIRSCLSAPDSLRRLTTALKRRDSAAATAVRDRCAPPAKLQALRKIPSGVLGGASGRDKEDKFNTFSLSIGASGMVGVGVGVTVGESYDISGAHFAYRFFTTGEGDFGWGAGAGVNVQVGLSRSLLPAEPEVQRGVSVTWGGDIIMGGSGSIDYSRDSRRLITKAKDRRHFREDALQGCTVGFGVGAGVELGTNHNTLTKYW